MFLNFYCYYFVNIYTAELMCVVQAGIIAHKKEAAAAGLREMREEVMLGGTEAELIQDGI